MLKDITAVHVRSCHRLWLRFEDGEEGEVAVATSFQLTGELAALKDPKFFAQVRVNKELGTVVWPNGADLDPVVLHALATGRQLPRYGSEPAASNF